jgi:hypothetical protein
MNYAPKRRASHPVRLGVLTLIGAGVGLFFAPVPVNDFNGWQEFLRLIYAIVGALVGAASEIWVRFREGD